MAFATEVPPATASVVTGPPRVERRGLDGRPGRDRLHERPMSIYEMQRAPGGRAWTTANWPTSSSTRGRRRVHPRRVHAAGRAPVRRLLGLPGHLVLRPDRPGSARPDDLRYLIDRLHQAGIGVILDWVPAHFPKDEWALARFDGTSLYEHADPRRGEQPDWGTSCSTSAARGAQLPRRQRAVLGRGVPRRRPPGRRGGLDALPGLLPRADWAPNIHGGNENLEAVAFLQEINATVYREVPGVLMIAEESTAWPGVTRPTHLGGLGFGLKWNMGWMHDTLGVHVEREPVYRSYHHGQLTFSMMYAFSENFVLPISHDEVVHGKGSLLRKMPGDRWQQLANLRAFLAYMWAHPGKQLLFMGSEFGQDVRVGREPFAGLVAPRRPGAPRRPAAGDRPQRGLQGARRAVVAGRRPGRVPVDRRQRRRRATCCRSCGTEPSAPSERRRRRAGRGSALACVVNFSGGPHHEYRIGLPRGGHWREVLNTDAEGYGGSGVGNLGGVEAVAEPWHGQPFSATLAAPPLGAVWFVHEG